MINGSSNMVLSIYNISNPRLKSFWESIVIYMEEYLTPLKKRTYLYHEHIKISCAKNINRKWYFINARLCLSKNAPLIDLANPLSNLKNLTQPSFEVFTYTKEQLKYIMQIK